MTALCAMTGLNRAGFYRSRLPRQGIPVDMREDNLLCIRHRAFVITTDSRHDLPIYPNLACGMELTAVNQLWVADITYI